MEILIYVQVATKEQREVLSLTEQGKIKAEPFV